MTSSTYDPNTANNTDTEDTTVTPVADLVISKSDSPDPVYAAGTLTYTITVTNNGPSTATNVVVTDTYPSDFSFVSSDPVPSTGNNQWSLGSIASGGGYAALISGSNGQDVGIGVSKIDISIGKEFGIYFEIAGDVETDANGGDPRIELSRADRRPGRDRSCP